ncbi:MAG: DNA repair protein RadC [Treponema sp.]|nr:DNA repair protein RadC [Treponema sp.]
MTNTTISHPDVREQVLKRGFSYPSDDELVMLILGSGTKDFPIQRLARDVVKKMYTADSKDLVQELASIKGMGMSKSLAIAAAIELGRRRSLHLNAIIRHPSDVVTFVKNYSVLPKEHFICITLNGGHEIIKIRVVTVGTINRTLVHPREVFSEALMENAAAIIVCHNHPSGSCTPSLEDIEATRNLLEAANIIGISLLDHIILDREGYFSFLEHNLLFNEQ